MLKSLSPATLGVALALLAYLIYSGADAIVKSLGGSLSPFEIGFFTTLFSLIPAALTKPKTERWADTFRINRFWLVQLVGLTRMICSVSITYSFVHIPLAEAYSIVFLTPVATMVLSVLILREEVTLDRWALAILSFVGVLIVVRPGFRELQLGHLTAVVCSVSAAISIIAMRALSGRERRTTLFVVPAIYTLSANAILLLITGIAWPGWWLVAVLIIGGICSGIGFLLQLAGLARAPASQIAPTQYSQMVWALVFGATFFNEIPDIIGIVGLAIVVASGIGNVFADGARARIAGRWAEYRGRRPIDAPTGFKGPGPDPV